MTQTLSVILAHGKVYPAVQRLLPIVKRLGHPIVMCCPRDDPYPGALRLWKKSERGGEGGIERTKALLDFLYRHLVYAIVFEYDAFCLKPHPAIEPGLRGIRGKFPNPMFLSPDYVLSPWTLDPESVTKMWHLMLKETNVTEAGEADRLLCAWAYLAGVPITAHPEPSFAENTIEMKDVPDVPKDAKWVHGIKSEEVFKAVIPNGAD